MMIYGYQEVGLLSPTLGGQALVARADERM